MLINFNHIKTLYNALVQKMKGFRGNWEQNDPTADDYIKNRTHYIEIGEAVILPLTTLTSGEVQLQQPLVKGQTYSIIWDGVTYESVAREYDGYLMLGNNAIYDYDNGIETDTGEPFALETDIGGNNAYIYLPVAPTMLDSDGSEITQHTISITTYGEIVHKLDKKFIDMPDGIVTEDSLPAILEDNLAPVSFSNDYNSLSGKPIIYTDVVRYGANQSLTTGHKTIARNNIGAANDASVVKYDSAQSLTDEQKAQARDNIGAGQLSIANVGGHGSASSSFPKPICYGNGIFITTVGGNLIRTSMNGLAWTSKTPIIANFPGLEVQYLCYGNGVFLASLGGFGSPGGRIYSSVDGVSWSLVKDGFNSYYQLSYANGRFFGLYCTTSSTFIYSDDGVSWATATSPTTSDIMRSVCYGAGKFVMNGDLTVYYSEDGMNWVDTQNNIRGVDKVCYGNGLFIAAAKIGSDVGYYYSTDGVAWSEFNSIATQDTLYTTDTLNISYGNNMFVFQVDGSNIVMYSYDGMNWYSPSLLTSEVYQSICYGDNKFIIFDTNGHVTYSYDGVHYAYQAILQNDTDVGPIISEVVRSYLSYEPNILASSTEGSTKRFKITVDDSGTLTATEVI